jgi:hypothetical protein
MAPAIKVLTGAIRWGHDPCSLRGSGASAAAIWFSVSDSGRDNQLHLGAGARLAPHVQLRSDLLGPLPHPGQSPMTRPPAFPQNLRVDPFPIVTDPQAEQVRVVLDRRFNPARAGVVEGVPQHLAPNPVDLVLDQGRQGSRPPFDAYLVYGRNRVPILGVPQFLSGGCEQVFEQPLSRSRA